jgi:outer membrane protein OmpA-like peptidoglycan-associated protein
MPQGAKVLLYSPEKEEKGRRLPSFLCFVMLTLWLSGCASTVRQPQQRVSNQELIAAFHQQGIAVQEQGRGIVLIIPHVSFAYKKAELSEHAQQLLRTVAATLTRPPASQRTIAVDGHTDAMGSADYNRHLSRARAEAVARVLIAGGVSKERVKVGEFGETFPIAPNRTAQGKDNPSGRAQNRRVELVILQPQP